VFTHLNPKGLKVHESPATQSIQFFPKTLLPSSSPKVPQKVISIIVWENFLYFSPLSGSSASEGEPRTAGQFNGQAQFASITIISLSLFTFTALKRSKPFAALAPFSNQIPTEVVASALMNLFFLVVSFPVKNMSASVGMLLLFPISWGSHIKVHGSKAPTRFFQYS
jgi:hypothetical protein